MKVSADNSTSANYSYSSSGLSGLASGVDTESMVKSMLSGLQSKIDSQNQKNPLRFHIIPSAGKPFSSYVNQLYRGAVTQMVTSTAESTK